MKVRIALPHNSGGSARSLSDSTVPVYANYYEVVFKVHGSNSAEYYFGSAVAGDGYLSVSVKSHKAYDILLLAGTEANHVLLGSAFMNKRD